MYHPFPCYHSFSSFFVSYVAAQDICSNILSFLHNKSFLRLSRFVKIHLWLLFVFDTIVRKAGLNSLLVTENSITEKKIVF